MEGSIRRLPAKTGSWPEGWWKLMERRVGILPVPVLVVLIVVLTAFIVTGKFRRRARRRCDVCTMLAVLAVGGFVCAEIGKRIPLIKDIAAPRSSRPSSVLSRLSFLHPAGHRPDGHGFHQADQLPLSLHRLHHRRLDPEHGPHGADPRFLKIFVPLAAGSVAAALVGTGVGTLLGLGAKQTFFYIVVPIMGGGVARGAIPLSVGYADILHLKQGDEFARVLPPVMFGSLTAILLSGTLKLCRQEIHAPDRRGPAPAGRA